MSLESCLDYLYLFEKNQFLNSKINHTSYLYSDSIYNLNEIKKYNWIVINFNNHIHEEIYKTRLNYEDIFIACDKIKNNWVRCFLYTYSKPRLNKLLVGDTFYLHKYFINYQYYRRLIYKSEDIVSIKEIKRGYSEFKKMQKEIREKLDLFLFDRFKIDIEEIKNEFEK